MINKYIFGELNPIIKTLKEVYAKGGLSDSEGAELHYAIEELETLREKLEA